MEIKVNDYVRTKNGEIGKVVNRYEVNDYYKVIVDIRNGFIEKHKEYLFKKYVKVSSPNIIDLIEVGDHVNNKRVTDIDIEKKKIYVEEMYYFNKKDIKSILTKEMFEQMEYKVD